MKHLAKIQYQFVKFAISWHDWSYERQKNYLKDHPDSKRKLTAKPEQLSLQSSTKTFKHKLGKVDYSDITKDKRYEFDDENSEFWNKADKWIEIDLIRVNEKYKGFGKIVLNDFLKTLPENAGIVLNANPIDNDISFNTLQTWYKKLGFQQISNNNISLYYTKSIKEA